MNAVQVLDETAIPSATTPDELFQVRWRLQPPFQSQPIRITADMLNDCVSPRPTLLDLFAKLQRKDAK